MKKLKYIFILILSVSFFYSVPFSYAKFKAVKYVEGSIIVPENNYCLNNNINTLSDCMLVMDSYSSSVSAAKSSIQAKGTPDFSNIAPQIKYKETDFVQHPSTVSSVNYLYTSDSYSFDETKGIFYLDSPYTKVVGDMSGNTFVGKYTCGNSSKSNCTDIYLIEEDSFSDNVYSITKSKHKTFSIFQTFDSDNGLYFADDDVGTNDSYYYRGNVMNNFVEFAGFYWRIIRRNGDGSIRLMYYSKDDISQGQCPFTSKFASPYWDPTYVGYAFNENDFSSTEIISANTSFNNFNELIPYYFGKGYTYNPSTKKFSITGSLDEGTIISGIWKNIYQDVIDNGYIYSCFTETNASCSVLMKINGYYSETGARVQYLSYGSTSYENAVKNNTKSLLYSGLDNWYVNNLSNYVDDNSHTIDDYLANEIFCNDRGINLTQNNGDGFSLSNSTFYNGNYRFLNHNPSFRCNQENDKFTLSSGTFGNKILSYPIGTLTLDELVFAGASSNKINPLFFINYSDGNYLWLMTPNAFYTTNRRASVYRLYPTGTIGANSGSNTSCVRPVINLKSTVKITGGDGTASNPYEVSLE
ncbi:MAG: hypothetical protein IJ193_07655 [Bacilli bacterium]|nr:hypothetical protein [Bacilli bacterium]